MKPARGYPLAEGQKSTIPLRGPTEGDTDKGTSYNREKNVKKSAIWDSEGRMFSDRGKNSSPKKKGDEGREREYLEKRGKRVGRSKKKNFSEGSP